MLLTFFFGGSIFSNTLKLYCFDFFSRIFIGLSFTTQDLFPYPLSYHSLKGSRYDLQTSVPSL